ncbi:MAG TPA: HD-GYP domain-containing protein, partial [Telluria sp.]
MYIHELCGSWLDTPFWKTSFLLDDPLSLAKVRHSKIAQAWIDTDKGIDLPVRKERAEHALPSQHVAAAATAAPAPVPVPAPTIELKDIAAVSMSEELVRASRVVNRSKSAMLSMFSEARMGRAIDTASAMSLVEEIASSVMRNPGALIGLARLKTVDDYSYMHSVAVCALMIALARQLELDDEQTRAAGLAGLLHDIGKMAVPAAILNKPGKLTDAEFAAVKQHCVAGHKMLLETKEIGAITLDVCLHHHERMDGSGYPDGLAGDQISLYARMGAVCDVYDAVTSNRPYKQGWCPAESMRKMAEWSHGHFDPVVFQAFVKTVGIYPVGTLVRLESG